MLQFLNFIVHFMCLMEPSRPIPLDQISHGNEGLFYYRKALSMEIFRQTNFSEEAIRLTAGDGGPSTGCQTHSNA